MSNPKECMQVVSTEGESFVDSLTTEYESANTCLLQCKFQPVLKTLQPKECCVNEISIHVVKSLVANK